MIVLVVLLLFLDIFMALSIIKRNASHTPLWNMAFKKYMAEEKSRRRRHTW